MLFAFEQMFLLFHLISFNNDDWILNPSTDYLLMMYPLPFWFSVSARVGIMIIIISIISLIISVYSNRKLA
jgi:integral membrane protein (TIGR01906 family)